MIEKEKKKQNNQTIEKSWHKLTIPRNFIAVAFPSPEEAPVTTAIRFVHIFSLFSSYGVFGQTSFCFQFSKWID